jgi:hypothetical protein
MQQGAQGIFYSLFLIVLELESWPQAKPVRRGPWEAGTHAEDQRILITNDGRYAFEAARGTKVLGPRQPNRQVLRRKSWGRLANRHVSKEKEKKKSKGSGRRKLVSQAKRDLGERFFVSGEGEEGRGG